MSPAAQKLQTLDREAAIKEPFPVRYRHPKLDIQSPYFPELAVQSIIHWLDHRYHPA
jgi:hypothetical protein